MVVDDDKDLLTKLPKAKKISPHDAEEDKISEIKTGRRKDIEKLRLECCLGLRCAAI